jgi:hypothetical protein
MTELEKQVFAAAYAARFNQLYEQRKGSYQPGEVLDDAKSSLDVANMAFRGFQEASVVFGRSPRE